MLVGPSSSLTQTIAIKYISVYEYTSASLLTSVFGALRYDYSLHQIVGGASASGHSGPTIA